VRLPALMSVLSVLDEVAVVEVFDCSCIRHRCIKNSSTGLQGILNDAGNAVGVAVVARSEVWMFQGCHVSQYVLLPFPPRWLAVVVLSETCSPDFC
jgi:hypothetical protein